MPVLVGVAVSVSLGVSVMLIVGVVLIVGVSEPSTVKTMSVIVGVGCTVNDLDTKKIVTPQHEKITNPIIINTVLKLIIGLA